MSQGIYDELLALSSLSTEAIKRIWDDPDKMDCDGGFSCDAVHEMLNTRGAGEYCAV